ncbi:gamma carbonic anhydrase family protein [Azospirillum rugosum]|uniref:Carbonic anhydrase/acetyltransferase-like protein (Isoleucine patch superfamily) n=1 Tax=Azospirillum rugosum TaxID=416170 RepID=A0ABS4SVV4_9PROT|nr:gamma carbonic anhydrase family protein [Azospirillum rugosum]MBP2296691.1 carbonic anhydrase/acetyltransferase-like protein (isoleucine patch superfamily) [Azospirillum rugosum]MDQ0530496.1 carbonic anhydrase/acetyltransferase-like protein (isoleucine patch superfamily) [Azospirillum rugosum]
MIYALDDKVPQRAEASWVAPSATVIGDVLLEEDVSIWWGAVLRAEQERIHIGAGSNVQDNAVLHVDPGFPLTLGRNVTVGHLAMVHGCTVGEGSLIGIGATVLNGARIGRDCLIGAHAFIAEGKEIPDRSLVLGAPGKVIRTLSDEDVERMHGAAKVYKERWKAYSKGLRAV